MKQIPNFFTLLNLFFGCIAIVFALQTQSVEMYINEEYTTSFNIPERIAYACLFIYIAALADFFDGFVARLFKATSEMGKQLDSLSDVVSFGVAPGVILYQLLRMGFMRDEDGLETPLLYLFPAFLISMAAAYRLAKFNLSNAQTIGFIGMPTPAVGLLIASFPLILHYGGGIININEWLINTWVLYSLIIVLSWLMLSKLPFMALKFNDTSLKNNLPKIILLVLAVIFAFIFHWLAVPLIFVTYIILSLIFKSRR